MSKSTARDTADIAWERFRDVINAQFATKREHSKRKTTRILRKGITLLIKV